MLIVAEVFTCTKCESLWQSDAHSLDRCLIECTHLFIIALLHLCMILAIRPCLVYVIGLGVGELELWHV